MSKNRRLQSVNKYHLKTNGDFLCRASHSETIRPWLGESGSQPVATRPSASPEKLSYITKPISQTLNFDLNLACTAWFVFVKFVLYILPSI